MIFTRKSSTAFAIGILIGLQMLVLEWLSISKYWWVIFIMINIFIILIFQFKKYDLILYLFGIILGLIKVFFWHPDPPIIIPQLYDQKVEMIGIVSAFPEQKKSQMIYDVSLQTINNQTIKYTRIRIQTDTALWIERGKTISIQGVLEEPFESEEFSYKAYLSRKNIHGIINYPEIKIIKQENIFWKYFGNIRYSMQNHIQQKYTYPFGGFLEGLLLGRRYGLSPEMSDVFQMTGLTHIIAISGYNITLVILIMSNLFSFLGRYLKIVFSTIGIILFTILVGAEPAVVRACLMGCVGLLGLFFGRQTFVWSSLLWAIVIMNIMDPRTLLFDVGFQLSVVATIGVVALSKNCIQWFSFLPNIFEIRESFAVTIAAQITTLPLLIYYFNTISFVSPFANVLAAPFLPWAMLFGFLELCLSFIPIVSTLLLYITQLLLKITSQLAIWCSLIPFANVEVPPIPPWSVILFYIGMLPTLKFILKNKLIKNTK